MLVQLEALTESLRPKDGLLQGRLKLAAPFGYGRLRVAPLLARVAKLHPLLKLELELFDSAAIQLLIPTLKHRSKKVQALSIFLQSALGYAAADE